MRCFVPKVQHLYSGIRAVIFSLQTKVRFIGLKHSWTLINLDGTQLHAAEPSSLHRSRQCDAARRIPWIGTYVCFVKLLSQKNIYVQLWHSRAIVIFLRLLSWTTNFAFTWQVWMTSLRLKPSIICHAWAHSKEPQPNPNKTMSATFYIVIFWITLCSWKKATFSV